MFVFIVKRTFVSFDIIFRVFAKLLVENWLKLTIIWEFRTLSRMAGNRSKRNSFTYTGRWQQFVYGCVASFKNNPSPGYQVPRSNGWCMITQIPITLYIAISNFHVCSLLTRQLAKRRKVLVIL